MELAMNMNSLCGSSTSRSAALLVFLGALVAIMAAPCAGSLLASSGPTRWSDGDLVTSYKDLRASGQLEAAVRAPNLPKEPPLTGFLDALAWFAAGIPERPGTLTLEQLDDFIGVQVQSYMRLLQAKVDSGDDNDYSRTRTWKVIQKMTMLREEMSRPTSGGRYAFPAIAQAPDGDDPWEREHTLDSLEEFRDKVCRGSHERPVLVKFGNTNCTQCMLFELTGSGKEFAENPSNKGAVDVYKVWWGFRPDESFAGKIRNPARLDDLVQAEGVKSSPTFIVYRNGRSYPCEDAFPDNRGVDERLESCVRQEFREVPIASSCAAENAPTGTPGR
jgi:hypothetical protein